MKRCWFAVVLLTVLLAGSLWVTDYMESVHAPLAEAVGRAGEISRLENWDEARAALTQIRDRWDRSRRTVAVFADHEPMEEVDALFAQLEVAGEYQDGPAFASLCAHLKEALEALGEAHGPSWWNLL